MKGENKKKIGKVHYKTHFYLPKTLKLARNPKYARKSLPKDAALDKYSIVKCPLTTETAMKMVEVCLQFLFRFLSWHCETWLCPLRAQRSGSLPASRGLDSREHLRRSLFLSHFI